MIIENLLIEKIWIMQQCHGENFIVNTLGVLMALATNGLSTTPHPMNRARGCVGFGYFSACLTPPPL